MIQAEDWFREAGARGFDTFTGVPCSFLTPFINYAIGNEASRYVGAASEGEAVAIGAGAWLGGNKNVVMCQNSGLGNMVNPLTSLSYPFRIPSLLIVTWRGQPGLGDQPQHELMGRATAQLLDAMEIPHALFPNETEEIVPSLERAEAVMEETGRPFALVMRKGSVAKHALADSGAAPTRPPGGRAAEGAAGGDPELSRREALAIAVDVLGSETALLATTGKLGRELFFHEDRANQLYFVGALGCVSGMGLGLALSRPERKVAVLDGDGSLLMKMGTLATIGHHAPENLVHVVFDNGRHESTGGQATVSPTVSFAEVALGAGYRRAWTASSAPDVERVLREAAGTEGPVLVHLRVAVRTDKTLGRPTVRPEDVARRFRTWIAGGSAS